MYRGLINGTEKIIASKARYVLHREAGFLTELGTLVNIAPHGTLHYIHLFELEEVLLKMKSSRSYYIGYFFG